MLRLQAVAGNRAVGRLLAREVVRDAQHKAVAIRFRVGAEVSLGLAQKAQQLAQKAQQLEQGGIDDGGLRELRAEALSDESVDDDERMFMAGLVDPGNARQVAAARITPGTAFTFTRASIERHVAHVHDLDRPAIDPRIASEREAAERSSTPAEKAAHTQQADKEVAEQLYALAGPPGSRWHARLAATVDYALANGVRTQALLEAMLSAASDDTVGDRVMAATVYVVAAAAGNPMADAVRTGRLEVDQVAPGGHAAALYVPLAAEATAAAPGVKGDTIYVPDTLDVNDVGDRASVNHELSHTADDAASGPNVRIVPRDQGELRAYVAQARYALAEAAKLKDQALDAACRQIAAKLNAPYMAALIIAARAERQAYEPIVRKINGFSSSPLTSALLNHFLDPTLADNAVVAKFLELIRSPQHGEGIEDSAGNEIPGRNDVPMDGLAGESVLDWVDRR